MAYPPIPSSSFSREDTSSSDGSFPSVPVSYPSLPETSSSFLGRGDLSSTDGISKRALGPLGKKDWKDAFGDVKSNISSYIPYLNAKDIYDSARMFKLSHMVLNEEASREEEEELDRFLADRQRESSMAYKVWSVALRIPAYSGEFLTGGGIIKLAAGMMLL